MLLLFTRVMLLIVALFTVATIVMAVAGADFSRMKAVFLLLMSYFAMYLLCKAVKDLWLAEIFADICKVFALFYLVAMGLEIRRIRREKKNNKTQE